MSILDPLKKVIGKWRSIDSRLVIEGTYTICAREAEALIPEMEAEIAALTEKMACGHPKACQYQINPTDAAENHVPPIYRCGTCEHKRLAVAAAVLAGRGKIDAEKEDYALMCSADAIFVEHQTACPICVSKSGLHKFNMCERGAELAANRAKVGK